MPAVPLLGQPRPLYTRENILARAPPLDTTTIRANLGGMTREDLIVRIKALECEIRAEGVEHLAIFGSRARGDAYADSDLDVLIDIRQGARFSLLNLSGVGLVVEQATGIKTQVVMARSAPEDFKSRIADDLMRVF